MGNTSSHTHEPLERGFARDRFGDIKNSVCFFLFLFRYGWNSVSYHFLSLVDTFVHLLIYYFKWPSLAQCSSIYNSSGFLLFYELF